MLVIHFGMLVISLEMLAITLDMLEIFLDMLAITLDMLAITLDMLKMSKYFFHDLRFGGRRSEIWKEMPRHGSKSVRNKPLKGPKSDAYRPETVPNRCRWPSVSFWSTDRLHGGHGVSSAEFTTSLFGGFWAGRCHPRSLFRKSWVPKMGLKST